MNTGQIISGTGHLALIGWALIGGAFQSAPEPFEVIQATTVSEADFAAIMDRAAAPEAVATVDTPEPPAEGEAAPPVAPEAGPPPEAAPPAMQPPPEDMAVMVPEESRRPQPRPAPRVAPEPAPQPEPDVRVDDTTRPEVTPDEGAETVAEPSEATAPEEAAREIVTEAEETEAPAQAAPTASMRPRSRPDRPVPPQDPPTETAEAPRAPDPEPEPEPEPPRSDRAAIDDALAAALGGAQQDTGQSTGQNTGQSTERPSGPPLTGGERDALRVAVQRCWNVGSLSTEALRTSVVVAVSMTRDGRPEIGSIRLAGSTGGGDAAAKQAFDAARRAIIRCGTDGFDLPVEKYDQWRDIEMTFNPDSMRIR